MTATFRPVLDVLTKEGRQVRVHVDGDSIYGGLTVTARLVSDPSVGVLLAEDANVYRATDALQRWLKDDAGYPFLKSVTTSVEDAVVLFRRDPVLGPAALALQAYKDAMNGMSDGWAYWSRGRKPTEKLQTIIEDAMLARHRNHPRREWTEADVRKALTPMKSAATRLGIPFKVPA